MYQLSPKPESYLTINLKQRKEQINMGQKIHTVSQVRSKLFRILFLRSHSLHPQGLTGSLYKTFKKIVKNLKIQFDFLLQYIVDSFPLSDLVEDNFQIMKIYSIETGYGRYSERIWAVGWLIGCKLCSSADHSWPVKSQHHLILWVHILDR